MKVMVTYGGDPIPKSPFTVGVAAPLDLSKVKVNGLENSKYSMGLGAPWPTSEVFSCSVCQLTCTTETYGGKTHFL